MVTGDEDSARKTAAPGFMAWLPDFSAWLVKAAEDTMVEGASAADRWARRSLEEGEWSVDAVTADVLADWERMTPLMGRWLDLWLEAVQQGFSENGRVDAVGSSEGDRSGYPDVERLVKRRFREYVELWEGASSKLKASSYRSDDLLDDWFRFWGNAVRDMTAGSALLMGVGLPNAARRKRDSHDAWARGADEL